MKLFIYILFFINLSASNLNLNYIGELSLFGKVADASINYFNDGKHYHIKVSGRGSGIIARLTNNRHYVYESIGDVHNEILIPKTYITSEITADENSTKIYTFDYQSSSTIVETHKVKVIDNSKFNIITFKYDKDQKIIEKKKKKIIKNIYNDDMVSVFFNKRNKLLNMNIGDVKILFAVGSKDMQKGMIVKLKSIKDDLYTYSIEVKKDYLDSGSEEAEFILDKNNILSETSLDGILLFGNAKIKRIR